jgi:hypothetical protein
MTEVYLFSRKSSDAPCNDRKISLPKKYNLVFLSNFFHVIFPIEDFLFQIYGYQAFTRLVDKKLRITT